ncbi:MAG: hypothetical protein KGI58_00925 [Patescibacteria group bacterium]|nr:hypothetical protein [Patescibacteria group bacterium]
MKSKKGLNKKIQSGFAWFVIFVAVFMFMYSTNSAKKKMQSVIDSIPSILSVKKTEASIPADVLASSTPITPRYRRALTRYANARLEVSDTCHITPDKATFKDGTNIMLDNISTKDHTLLLDEPAYILAHKYKIVNMFGVVFPKTINVGCDNIQNAATITIVK